MTTVLFVAAVLAVVFTVYPLFKSRPQAPAPLSSEFERLQDLYSRRDANREAIKELEADWQSGGLSEQEYRELEQKYWERADSILKSIGGVAQGGGGAKVEDEIERRVAQLRQEKRAAPISNCPRCGAVIKAGHRFCVKCGLNLTNLKPVLVCPNCKKGYKEGDRFCPQCGTSLPG